MLITINAAVLQYGRAMIVIPEVMIMKLDIPKSCVILYDYEAKSAMFLHLLSKALYCGH